MRSYLGSTDRSISLLSSRARCRQSNGGSAPPRSPAQFGNLRSAVLELFCQTADRSTGGANRLFVIRYDFCLVSHLTGGFGGHTAHLRIKRNPPSGVANKSTERQQHGHNHSRQDDIRMPLVVGATTIVRIVEGSTSARRQR